MKRTILTAFLALVGCATVNRAREAQRSAAAQGESVVVDTTAIDLKGRALDALVAFALTNRPVVVAARLSLEDARLQLKEIAADAPLLSETPWNAAHLSLSGAYAEESAGTTLRDHDWRTDGKPSAALSLDILLYDFGRNRAKARAQAERVIAAEQTLLNAGYTVFGQVATAYFSYRENAALLEVARTNEAQYAAHLARADGRHKAGLAQELDVLKASLDLAQAREKVVACSNDVVTSSAELLFALGIDAEHGNAVQILGAPPRGLNAAELAFDLSRIDIGAAYAFARTNAPAVALARAKLRAASRDVDYAIADLKPKASASLGLSWADPLWAWNWGVSAAQNLFSGFSKVTAVDRARVALESARVTVEQAEHELSRDLDLVLAERDNAVQALRTARATLSNAEKNLEVVSRQVDVGAASRIELSEAIAARSTALGSALSALYAGQTAEAKLFRLLGRYPEYHVQSTPIHE